MTAAPDHETAAQIYTELRDLADRLTDLQRARVLTLDGNPERTQVAVREALAHLDQAAERIGQLETLNL